MCAGFCRGSVYDLMSTMASHTDVMDSVWHVVHAVNNLPEFRIEYPSSVDEQRRIAADFERKPSLREQSVGVVQMKFFAVERASLGSTVKPLAMSMAEFLT
ncbi:hypothetical protein ACHAW5_007662 [Stephanodiscus triporus]|uniref:Uncharacterized protein n=1 Tax=Stephanodiscus triporus TaxID=2934178 RepID=A0ABD3MVH3_9STRA